MPRQDECCIEDVDTSGYKGDFIDIRGEEDTIVNESKEEEEELVI